MFEGVGHFLYLRVTIPLGLKGKAVLWGVQRAQPSWASQSDGPQEKNYCSISPPPLKKEK